jgi:predicted tellurium resistance membrane protein TerC
MLLLFAASAFIARLMERFTWLLDLASVVLAWTAANLILEDPKTVQSIHLSTNQQLAVHLGFVALILLIDLFVRAASAHARRGRPKPVHQTTGKLQEQTVPSRDSNPSL